MTRLAKSLEFASNSCKNISFICYNRTRGEPEGDTGMLTENAPPLTGQAQPLLVVGDKGGTKGYGAVGHGPESLSNILPFATPEGPESLDEAAALLAENASSLVGGRRP